MILKKIFTFCLLLGFLTLQAQSEDKFHLVKAGETKYGISRQYNISIEDLERFNPEIKDGLKVGMQLLIPETEDLENKESSTPKDTATGKFIFHEVQPKETLYSLSRTYGTTVEQIELHNPQLSEGLKVGQRLKIPTTTQLEVRDEENYVYHLISKTETPLKLSEKYSLSLDSLYLLNPEAKAGLVIGRTLKFPRRAGMETGDSLFARDIEDNAASDTTVKGGYFLYKVKTGDSFFSLQNEFKVNRQELIKLNPEIANGLEVDKYIIIPKKEPHKEELGWLDKLFDKVEPDSAPDTSGTLEMTNVELQTDSLKKIPSATFHSHRIALMLPFHAEVVDSLETERKGYSTVALEFYNGFLLAADSMANAGMNIRLKVIDTKRDMEKIRKEISELRQSGTEMVVGPLFKESVEFVADELEKDQIPVVSPLSKSVDVEGRPNLIQCIPGSIEVDSRIAKMLNAKFQDANVIFAHSGSADDRKDVLQMRARVEARAQTSYLTEVHTDVESSIYRFNDIKEALDPDRRNVVVVTSENQVLLSDIINKLRQLRDSSIYMIGPARISRLPTLEVDYLNQLNVIIPDINYVDYDSPQTVKFIAEYRSKYHGEPSRFAFQGYDVGLYFLSQLRKYGEDFTQHLESPTVMLSSGFQMKRAEDGGWQNIYLFSTGIRQFELVRLEEKTLEKY